jgi:hypothetical protein
MTQQATSFTCPNGHVSIDPDYCSECGDRLDPEACPGCGMGMASGIRYCEACGYDLRAGDVQPAAHNGTLWVAVQADPTLVDTPDHDAEQLFPLDLAETRLGRFLQSRAPEAEITIDDPGISRCHLAFSRDAEGQFSVRDLNSTNGTQLNGVDLAAGVEMPIKPGDLLELGEWTRLAIRAG